jgi:hypothetical protein
MGQQPPLNPSVTSRQLIAVGTQRDVLIVNPAATAILGSTMRSRASVSQALAAYPSLVGFQDAL